jgi:aspartate racemase
MKTIGILGGMSWQSTAHYYRRINEGVQARLGGLHSARIVLASVDFADIEPLQAAGDWDGAGRQLAEHACALERAGADFLVLATNTMHRCADDITDAIEIPFLHLADATAEAIGQSAIGHVGLLGTRYTMEQPFYRERLEHHGIVVDVPNDDERARLNRIIFEELCLGSVTDESRRVLQRMIQSLSDAGAQAVIAGCTEITMLVQQDDSPLPLFDTTAIHCDAAVEFALADARA